MDVGRAPETKALGLDKVGVRLHEQTGKIIVGADESTSVPNIYAFGDIGEVRLTHPAEKRFEFPVHLNLSVFVDGARRSSPSSCETTGNHRPAVPSSLAAFAFTPCSDCFSTL